jgi:type I restriction enzyme S subunit
MSVRLQDVRYYPEAVPEAALLREGDLLFTRYNGNPDFTAVCGRVAGLTRYTAYPDKLIRVRLSEMADPRFVEAIASAPQSRDWLHPYIKTAAGQHGISGADLKLLPMPLPPVTQQRYIAGRIKAAFNWIDRLASETNSARKLIDHLDQAILAKAFRGELVPQDPNDEPASGLMKRIRAEREGKSSTKQRKIKSKK